jgi:dynein heavy chain
MLLAFWRERCCFEDLYHYFGFVQDYLETKRIAFPRFYFVAPADLLDILSKGSNPQAILRHLSKCFDNVHNLSFRKDERGEATKVSTIS